MSEHHISLPPLRIPTQPEPYSPRDIASVPGAWAGVSLSSELDSILILTYLVGSDVTWELWLSSETVKIDDDFDPSADPSFRKVAGETTTATDGRVEININARTIFLRVSAASYIELSGVR